MAACSQQTMPVKSDVFYSIDKDGNVLAVNAKGVSVPLKRVEIPFKHDITAIKNIEHLTIIELEGSHFRLICTSSRRCYYQEVPD